MTNSEPNCDAALVLVNFDVGPMQKRLGEYDDDDRWLSAVSRTPECWCFGHCRPSILKRRLKNRRILKT